MRPDFFVHLIFQGIVVILLAGIVERGRQLIRKVTISLGLIICMAVALMPLSAESVVSAATYRAPQQVTGVKTSRAAYDAIRISWYKNPGTTGYAIYRSRYKTRYFKRVATIWNNSTFSYTDTGLLTSRRYYYQVRAFRRYNITKTKRKYTWSVPTVTWGRTYIVRPQLTAARYTPGKNLLSWQYVGGATGYKIYRSTKSDSGFQWLMTVRGATQTTVPATSGKKYYYRTRAYRTQSDGIVNSYYSDIKGVTTNPAIRIFIACGHGTDSKGVWDTGTTYLTADGQNLTEADLMLPITKAMVAYMRQADVTVYTDADNDNNENILYGVERANNLKVKAYVSIHCDWYKAPAGTLPLYRYSTDKTLATDLNAAVTSNLNIATRGLSYRTDLRELNKTSMPACIFETGSIKEDYYLFQTQYDAYGRALAMGMCNYLGTPFIE